MLCKFCQIGLYFEYGSYTTYTRTPPQELRSNASIFELAPVGERLALPFIYSDPDFHSSPEPLSVQSSFGQILRNFQTGDLSNEYDMSSFNCETLNIILHYALSGKMRSSVVEARKRGWEALTSLQPLKGLRIVDYGCGRTGRFVQAMRSLGAEAYGIDARPPINSDIVPSSAVGREQHPELFNADIVTCTYVFGVADDQQQDYGEDAAVMMYNLLKPGGIVINFPKPRAERDNPVIGMQKNDATVKTFSGKVDPTDYWNYDIGRKALPAETQQAAE